MSTKLDKSIAEKMNKKGCVEITNFDKLQKELSKQIGTLGISNKCEYTTSDNRNHFLKSSFDNWQEEYRIIWKGVNNSLDVIIPKGIAEDVSNLMS